MKIRISLPYNGALRGPACGPPGCGSVLLILLLGPAISLCAQQPPGASHSSATAVLDSLAAPPSGLPVSTSPSASIHGIVAAGDGTVYEGAHVTLEDSSRQSAIASTDDAGQFRFTGIAPGSFKLTIAAEGFESTSLSGVLSAGEDYDAHSIALPMSSATSAVEVYASRHEVAQEQLHEEEQQRVLGIVPNFYVSYSHDAVPLSARQKFHLSWRSSIDPLTLLGSGFTAATEQADNDFKEYGQGTEGYAKRFGANYADNVIGTMIGSALLPSLLHQDPRYFYHGTGTVRLRVLYAVANSVVCKSDQGRWQPNYSNFLGDLASAGISNLYYPPSERGSVALMFKNIGIGKATAAGQNLLQEFVIPHFTRRQHSTP